MGQETLQGKLRELRQELLATRAKMASTKVADNPGKFKQIKKTIARIKTLATERRYKLD